MPAFVGYFWVGGSHCEFLLIYSSFHSKSVYFPCYLSNTHQNNETVHRKGRGATKGISEGRFARPRSWPDH